MKKGYLITLQVFVQNKKILNSIKEIIDYKDSKCEKILVPIDELSKKQLNNLVAYMKPSLDNLEKIDFILFERI